MRRLRNKEQDEKEGKATKKGSWSFFAKVATSQLKKPELFYTHIQKHYRQNRKSSITNVDFILSKTVTGKEPKSCSKLASIQPKMATPATGRAPSSSYKKRRKRLFFPLPAISQMRRRLFFSPCGAQFENKWAEEVAFFPPSAASHYL